MELNHILLFSAIATSALMVLQAFQPQSPGARARAGIVLIASALAWLLARPIAGWLAAIVWCALLVVPAFLRNRARAARYHYRRAGSDRQFGSDRFGITVSPVVLALIIINVAAFILELLAGGSTNPMTLHRLGELDTHSVIVRHQYWRLLTALFLHYGPVHIFFNLFALLLLGPALERQIGGFLFAVCYLVSGHRVERRRRFANETEIARTGATRRCLRLHYGRRRHMDRFSPPSSPRSAGPTTFAKHLRHRAPAIGLRPGDSSRQHVSPPRRPPHRIPARPARAGGI